MSVKVFTTASFAVMLMASGAMAQDSSSDILLPKKNQSQGAAEQGGQQPDANAVQKQSTQDGAGGNASAEQGQAEADQSGGGKKLKAQGADEQNGGGTAQTQTGEQSGGGRKAKQADQQQNADKATGSVSKAEDIPAEKRRVIREKLVTKSVTKIERSKIGFDINVGVAVPSTIVLAPLPVEVVEIVPAYRGYQYFLLADGTIVIVEPGSLQIVFVLSA